MGLSQVRKITSVNPEHFVTVKNTENFFGFSQQITEGIKMPSFFFEIFTCLSV